MRPMRTVTCLACLALLACDQTDEPGVEDVATDSRTPDTRDAPDTHVEPDLVEVSDGADTSGAEVDTAVPDVLAEVVDTHSGDTSEDTGDAEPDLADTFADPDVTPAPPAIDFTIAAIPTEMNGSRPARTPTGELAYRLRANRARVDLDVLARPESGPFGPSDLSLACIADGVAHALPAVMEHAPGHLQVAIDDAHAFPDGAEIVCTATISTAGGTSASSLTFDAATLPPRLDPFPTTDVWLVRTHRDIFALDVTELPDGTSLMLSDYSPDGDGVDDFAAPFFELGVMPQGDPAAAAAIRAHLLTRVRAIANGIYGLDAQGRPTPGGVDLHLAFEGDEGAPDPADFGKPGHRFSMIALTGDGARDDQLGGTFGRALIDWNNQDIEDDTVFGLGVWPAAIARTILANPAGALLLADIRPALGGTPFGLEEGDDLFIGRDVDPATLPSAIRQRAQRYGIIIQFGSLALAAILTHEIGHSLGLVPFGAPPDGLFAGIEADFTVTFAPDAHIDTIGLNVMQTGGSVNWLEAATGDLPRFEPLSWAYLRRQLVVGSL